MVSVRLPIDPKKKVCETTVDLSLLLFSSANTANHYYYHYCRKVKLNIRDEGTNSNTR